MVCAKSVAELYHTEWTPPQHLRRPADTTVTSCYTIQAVNNKRKTVQSNFLLMQNDFCSFSSYFCVCGTARSVMRSKPAEMRGAGVTWYWWDCLCASVFLLGASSLSHLGKRLTDWLIESFSALLSDISWLSDRSNTPPHVLTLSDNSKPASENISLNCGWHWMEGHMA